jgi:ABC transport system ATP-binding/permease protein
MNQEDLKALWQDQPSEAVVPSELALSLTMPPSPDALDYAQPTSQFRAAPVKKARSRVFMFAALAAVLVLSVAGLGVATTNYRPPPLDETPSIMPVRNTRPPPTPAELLESALAACRTSSSPESGAPDWDRARVSCERALELEPIHEEANALLKRISVLSVCDAQLTAAKEQGAAGRLEAALVSLGKIDKSCEHALLRAMAFAPGWMQEVKKQSGKDCLIYARNEKWVLAHERCEVYARYACQELSPSELYPPALLRLKLRGPLDPKREWRPKDERYLAFLAAREKELPGAPMWRCPELPALRAPPAPPDPSALAQRELAARSSEPAVGWALTAYFQGELHSAPIPLQKLLGQMSRAEHHAMARALLLDLNEAINLYENGTTELSNDRPEKAAELFRRALEVDARLMLGESARSLSDEDRRRELSKRQSFIRKSIIESMATNSYEKGKTLADRKDFRAACRSWKLGSTFSRSNIDLLKALTNVCTRRAAEMFERAQTCDQLRVALDYAVDGDGIKEKVEATLAEEQCR